MAKFTEEPVPKKKSLQKTPHHQMNFVGILVFLVFVVGGGYLTFHFQKGMYLLAGLLLGGYFSLSPKIVAQWEKAIVLRFGKFHRQLNPGLHWIFPLVDRVAYWIDQRVRTTSFSAEKTLTKDSVPVDVDAVLFWVVWDAQRAALEVENYQSAISWAAQTALRDLIGRTLLADVLAGRQTLDAELQKLIDERTEPWGVTVQSVEIRDVVIPEILEDAMSRQAQAERERQARVILGDAERQIADKFMEAAKLYQNNPVAFHLRAMNMLYEGLKEKGALIVVPSTAVESMGLGTITGLSALGKEFQPPQQT